MRQFSLVPWYEDGTKCNLYTVQFLDEDQNETDKFFEKYSGDEQHSESAYLLFEHLTSTIANKRGAIEAYFNRPEHEVIGLPHHGRVGISYFPRFPLRIYSIRISEDIVILLCGGVKDKATNQESKLSGNWYMSCQLARAIFTALNDGTIIEDTENKKLSNSDGSGEMILP